MLVDVTEAEVASCEFSRWSALFLDEDGNIPSRVIVLSPDFVEYLLADGVFLPRDVEDEVAEEPGRELVSFPALSRSIQEAIDELGGRVFVKLNWSAPTDADWIRHGALRCSCAADVYLLLKSSDRAVFDIEHMYASVRQDILRPHPVTLVLRQWKDIQPSMEFRCFVFRRSLVGVCQRECTTCYPFLRRKKTAVTSAISRFFHSKVYPKFPLDSCKSPAPFDLSKAFISSLSRYL